MRNWIAILLCVIAVFIGCNKQQKQPEPEFKINYIHPSVTGNLYRLYTYQDLIIGMFFNGKFFVLDSSYQHSVKVEQQLNDITPKVSQVLFYRGNMLLFLDNRKFVALDSNFERQTKVEKKLDAISARTCFVIRDSLFLVGSNKVYREVGDYRFNSMDEDAFWTLNNILMMRTGYSDSNYAVSACGVGEFGGNAYFYNKKTNKAYSLPCYFGGVFFYKNAYHVIESYNPGVKFLTIDNPSRLYPATINADMFASCGFDSGYRQYNRMTNSERYQWQKEHGVTTYFESRSVQELTTFMHNDRLYSLCISDTSFIVLHHTDSVTTVQSFSKMDKRIKYYHTILEAKTGDKIVLGLSGTYWQSHNTTGWSTEFDQFGLVVIKGNKIDVYESYSQKPAIKK